MISISFQTLWPNPHFGLSLITGKYYVIEVFRIILILVGGILPYFRSYIQMRVYYIISLLVSVGGLVFILVVRPFYSRKMNFQKSLMVFTG